MLRRVFAQPVEQMMALASFCGGGVLERHPRLRAAFLEANCAWAPWLLWRLDEAYEREADVFVPNWRWRQRSTSSGSAGSPSSRMKSLRSTR